MRPRIDRVVCPMCSRLQEVLVNEAGRVAAGQKCKRCGADLATAYVPPLVPAPAAPRREEL